MKKIIICFALFLLSAQSVLAGDLLKVASKNDVTALQKFIQENNYIEGEEINDAFMLACAKGYADIAKILLKIGADIHFEDDKGNTALAIAKKHRRANVIQLINEALLEEKLLAAIEEEDMPKVRKFIDKGVKLNNIYAGQIIVSATGKGNIELVRLLLKHGANINAQNNSDLTPLMQATFDGNVEIVKFLLDKGADIHILTDEKFSALTYAVVREHIELAKMLLEKGANPNIKDSFDISMLMKATENKDMLTLLKKHGAKE